MAEALALINEAKITAVLSRTDEKAKNFVSQYDIEKAYSNREDFASDKNIDIVYIATPHNNHINDVLLCLKNNKHVLCEKPMGINSKEVETMVNLAREKKLFLMEAMWSRFFPAFDKAIELISNGEIGEIKHIDAKFCFRGPWLPEGRHLNPNLAGGALLDVGIYVLYLAILMVNEMPIDYTSLSNIGSTGVDEESAYLLKFQNGTLATLTSGIQTETKQNAYIYGTEGYIKLPMF